MKKITSVRLAENVKKTKVKGFPKGSLSLYKNLIVNILLKLFSLF